MLVACALALALAGAAAARPAGVVHAGATRRAAVRASCRLAGKRRRHARCARRAKTHGTRSVGVAANPSSIPATAGVAASAPAPTSTTAAEQADSGQSPAASAPNPPTPPVPLPSAWDEPALSHPITIELTAFNSVLALSQSHDYVLQCPSGGLSLSAALNVWGGHNVVLENCDIELSDPGWAARFSDQSGTLWVEGVRFGGSELTGGVQLQEPGATVVLRDVLFDRVNGSLSTNHAELIQTWAGPARLLIDGLTGSTTYQGLFLEPNQYYSGPPPTVFDLRHIDIDDSQGAYALWLADVTGSPPSDASGAILTWNVEDVYVVPNPARTWSGWWLWPKPETSDPTWAGAISGAPPDGSYVQATASGAAGVDEGAEPPALRGEQP
jgi:hypothetical protein